jgi:hypothetical protein
VLAGASMVACNISGTDQSLECSGHGICLLDNTCSCPSSYSYDDCSLYWPLWLPYNIYRWSMVSWSFILLCICLWRAVIVIRARQRASTDARLWTAVDNVQSVTLIDTVIGQLW